VRQPLRPLSGGNPVGGDHLCQVLRLDQHHRGLQREGASNSELCGEPFLTSKVT